jgi:ribonuclease HI
MDEHISRVIEKGTRACLSLQAIKGTRPAQMRQLFRSCVLLITDYVASAWYGPEKVGLVRLVNALEKLQRLGARLITRAWKKVALPILEAEACLGPTKERLERKVSAHVTKLISLPKSNPAKRALLREFNVITHVSPLGATVAVSTERLNPFGSRLPMGNPPWIHVPCIDQSHRVVIKEKDQAIRDTATIAGVNIVGIYTDASVAKRLAAIAVVQRIGIVTQVVRRDSIGWASTCGVLSAEIAAIAAALKYAQVDLKQVQQLVVFSDSQQALRAIQAGNDARTGRALLSKIAESVKTLCRAGIDSRYRWSPGHEGVVGNEVADDAAREASSHTGNPTALARERVREVAGVIRLLNRDRSEDPDPFDTTRLPGQYT